jgi:hypothetical protein
MMVVVVKKKGENFATIFRVVASREVVRGVIRNVLSPGTETRVGPSFFTPHHSRALHIDLRLCFLSHPPLSCLSRVPFPSPLHMALGVFIDHR